MIRLKLFFVSLLIVVISCQQSDNFDPQFALCLFTQTGHSSLLLLDDLDAANSSSLSVPLATEMGIGNREYLQKEGFIYRLSYTDKIFSKSHIKGGKLVVLDTLQLRNMDFETVTWIENDELIAISREWTLDRVCQARIYRINVKEMRIVQEDTLTLPFATKDYPILHVGLIDYQDGKLWIAYSFLRHVGKYHHSTLDTTYYATLDYPTLRMNNIQKDVRSSYPGGYNLIQSYSFKDDKGDFYFTTNPGVALGNRTELPSAIFRKKKNQTSVDEDYMINISTSIGNHAYGFWYAGNGKAIIRNEQKDKYTDFSNHHLVYQFEYRVVDLVSGDIEKIPVPLDKGTQKENVWVNNGVAYIGIDDESGEHIIWKYDMNTQKVQKGLRLPRDVSFIVRLDYLK